MKQIWNRFLDLIAKLVSVKGLIFCTVSALAVLGRVDSNTWLVCAGLFAGMRTLDKLIGTKITATIAKKSISDNNG